MARLAHVVGLAGIACFFNVALCSEAIAAAAPVKKAGLAALVVKKVAAAPAAKAVAAAAPVKKVAEPAAGKKVAAAPAKKPAPASAAAAKKVAPAAPAKKVAPAAPVKKVTPIEKVLSMLAGLQTQVENEGIAEAKTYDKFACFCKSTMKAKNEAITDGRAEKLRLESTIGGDSDIREKSDTAIGELVKKIKKLEDEIAKAKSSRTEERLTHDQNEVDLTGALRGIDSAVLALKAAKNGVGLVQGLPVIKGALAMAQALLPEHSQGAISLLSEGAPNDAYSFQSDSVMKTLQELRAEFVKKKDELNKAEASAKSSYEALVTNKKTAVKDKTEELETSKKAKAAATLRIATASTDLTTVQATLLDDQKYLADLAGKCNDKAVLWGKRTQARANELTALTQAIALIKSLSKKKSFEQDAVSAPEFLQELMQGGRQHDTASRAAGTVQQHQQPEPLQEASLIPSGTQLVGRRAHVLALLKEQAQVLRSSSLSAVVASASKDPLAKVKSMIQKLIERLLKEASSEANHKGFCDKEYASSTRARDKSFKSLLETNSLLVQSEARRDKLGLEIDALKAQLKQLSAAATASAKIRKEEKAENEKSIKEAAAGRKAVQDAMDILAKYYKTQAKVAKQSAAGAKPKGAPDAGFNGEYAGAQDGSVGVLGMLEVVKSDFERTIKQTKANEVSSRKTFLKFSTANGVSEAEKSQALKATTSAKSEADSEDTKNRGILLKARQSLDAALKEIDALDKACRLGGMTAEERKIQRGEEMAALNKALSILSKK